MTLIPDLQLQLRDAAASRRRRARRRALGALGLAAVVLAVGPGLLLRGADERRAGGRPSAGEPPPGALPVGTVIPKGEGTPPRDSESTIVASGTAPVTGPWQLEVWRSHGGPSPAGEPRGRCLFINALDPPPDGPSGLSGFCGGLGFRKTPGFSRAVLSVPRAGRNFVKELLVYGRVPERARAVVVTPQRSSKIEVEPDEGPKSVPGDFFAIPVRPDQLPGRINWLNNEGRPGSRGIALRL
jgi:hypothetical protein